MSELEHLRVRIREARLPAPRRKVWKPRGVGDFAFGVCLCFDQTLSRCGWSLLRSADGFTVADSGVLAEKVEGKGFEATYAKGLAMYDAIDTLLESYAECADAIVHEMPAVAGHRTESSLLAGFCIRLAARDHEVSDKIVMINKQRAFATMVGPKPYEKRYVTEAVNALIPPARRQGERWNQDVHDSVLLGLQWLHERREQQ